MITTNQGRYINARSTDAAELFTERSRVASLPAFEQVVPFTAARAIADAFSPRVISRFFYRLYRYDQALSLLGCLMLALVPLYAIAAWSGAQNPAALPAWIKPIKFSISFATYAWTLTFFLSGLRLSPLQRTIVRYAVVISVAVEMMCLSVQAWHLSSGLSAGFLDVLASHLLTPMITVNTAVVTWMAALFFRRNRIGLYDAALITAIRLSILIFLVGNAIGGYMLSRGSHTVGEADGGPGLPFVNWSTIAGDLRISHFLALHAIQALPLVAYVLAQFPELSMRRRRLLVAGAAALFSALVLATFVEALLGKPFLPRI